MCCVVSEINNMDLIHERLDIFLYFNYTTMLFTCLEVSLIVEIIPINQYSSLFSRGLSA